MRLHLGRASRPQLVNRLDRETSGVTLVAKDSTTARGLRRLWETRQVYKEYHAIVHGHCSELHGVIDAPLGKDEQSRVAIKDRVRADGAAARTEYWVVAELGGSGSAGPGDASSATLSRQRTGQSFTVLRVVPQTGRKHQIRIHLAHLGHPIVGDKLYGGDEDLYMALVEDRLTLEQRQRLILPHHALHAREVRFDWKGREFAFQCEPEPWFQEFVQRRTSDSLPKQSGLV